MYKLIIRSQYGDSCLKTSEHLNELIEIAKHWRKTSGHLKVCPEKKLVIQEITDISTW